MVKIEIIYDPATGNLTVNAPPDVILSYGLLELAKEVVRESARKQQSESRIQPVTMMPKLM